MTLLYHSHHLGNSKHFKSSVPGAGRKSKYVFLIINHNDRTRQSLSCGAVKVTALGTKQVSSEEEILCSKAPRVGTDLHFFPLSHCCRCCCRKYRSKKGNESFTFLAGELQRGPRGARKCQGDHRKQRTQASNLTRL